MTRRLGGALIIGDDLVVANLARLQRGVAFGAGNDMLLELNIVGTIAEAIDVAGIRPATASASWGQGRQGSIDDAILDIAMAVGALLVKCGASRTGERLGQQDRLLRREEFGDLGRFAGHKLFRTFMR